MLVAPENYKGIKFVRISSLPLEQKNKIWNSINPQAIIKILKGDMLLNDCIQYKHYETWHKNIYTAAKSSPEVNVSTDLAIAS